MQETLENRNKDLEVMHSLKNNNEKLLKLIERYEYSSKNLLACSEIQVDRKVIDLQNEIDLRDLRIKELEEEYGCTSQSINLGKSGFAIGSE